jgi:F-type H+-transporting ATPase subunit b
MSVLLEKLGINWGLLLAQIVNFVIVLTALTYFIYRPLLNLIDQRRERIRKSMEDVKLIDAQKKEMEDFKLDQMKKIDQEVGAFLERAKKEAEVSKDQILALAQEEADRIIARGEQRLVEERARVLGEVQGSVAEVIVRMTEKLLEREFSPADQKRVLAGLTKQVSEQLR